MADPVAAGHFQAVGGPVAEVQRPGRAEFEGVAAGADVLQVQCAAAADGFLHGGGVAIAQGGGAVAEPVEEGGILDDGDLEGLGGTADPVALGERGQEGKIVQHGKGRGKRAHEVLHAVLVHAVLDAHARVVLGQRGGGHSDEAQAAMDDRRGEANHVQHAAAADGNDKTLAVQVQVAHGPHGVAHGGPAGLGRFAAGNHRGRSAQFQLAGPRVEVLLDVLQQIRVRRPTPASTHTIARWRRFSARRSMTEASSPLRVSNTRRVKQTGYSYGTENLWRCVSTGNSELDTSFEFMLLHQLQDHIKKSRTAFANSRSVPTSPNGRVEAQAISRPGPTPPCEPRIREVS